MQRTPPYPQVLPGSLLREGDRARAHPSLPTAITSWHRAQLEDCRGEPAGQCRLQCGAGWGVLTAPSCTSLEAEEGLGQWSDLPVLRGGHTGPRRFQAPWARG